MVNRINLYLLPLFAYCLGSIPWGLVFTRLFGRGDIRKTGSGNIGATNVRRLAGNRLALLTLAADAAKGALPVWMATAVSGTEPVGPELYAAFVALLAFLGHLFPVYFCFKDGGKGVATAAGCFLVLSPWAVVFAGLVSVGVIWIGNRVSLGSLSGSTVLPVAVWINTRSPVTAGCAVIISCLIFLRHKENIKRLRSGKESVFRSRK